MRSTDANAFFEREGEGERDRERERVAETALQYYSLMSVMEFSYI